ncbi:Stk1 family PASTA domain-containing Ser/Thr kinase [Brachybacterium halotolerans subsp. kimchii]|uniref:Stk1 family PASTA domain-containing Ser/Thr kinase n=1 Tax=Brachybacterium halotolerans TaxID=2795215 RepID=UPI001E4D9DDE|nr:Stk1 family PASTA domain-containing Ser/Thr kinase [Brachybacterium halotolerans]UEJ82075.1 Stk1 family PASTA domain-containing Ser/Thr kinase [Brachybacterium halotolerans subsp. kimchii]
MSEENLILSGRYALGKALGHGGMADVHLAEDRRLHRTVAVKILRTDLARDTNFQERFRREAQSAAGLNHPSIVAVYDTGEEHAKDFTGHEITIPYIVMEYVRGKTLREYVDPEHPMDVGQAATIMQALLSALEYSHQQGIVHRDIKPGNIMITDEGDVKVMDFGIARAVADATGMTQTQAVMGTAQYLSPEQARGQLVDARSDIYSAACVFYELVTGRPPFTGDSPVSIAYQHVRETPVPPSRYNPAITPEVDRVILTGLAKDRETRYPSATAFARDIASVIAGRRPQLVAGDPQPTSDAEATTVLSPVDDRTEALPASAGATQTHRAPVAAAAGAGALGAGAAGAAGAGMQGAGSADEPGEELEQKPKRPVWLIVLIIVAVLAVIAAALALWQPWNTGPKQVAVPQVVGMTEAQAKSELESEGLTGTFEKKASSDVDEGDVISTDPEGGTEVDEHTAVKVAVSSGPEQVEVPDLAGMDRDEATKKLDDLGLGIEIGDPKDVAGKKAGTVVGQDPASGSNAEAGDTVTVNLASGDAELPDVTGLDEDTATKTLEDQGFEVDATTKESDDEDPGTVTGQTPTGGDGKTAEVGSTVQIVVAKAPGNISMPNVVGQTESEARKTLGAKNLGVKVTYQSDDSVAKDTVIKTDPTPNTSVKPGATVTVYVSTGPEKTEEPSDTPTSETPSDTPTDTPSDTPSDSETPSDSDSPTPSDGDDGDQGDDQGGDNG